MSNFHHITFKTKLFKINKAYRPYVFYPVYTNVTMVSCRDLVLPTVDLQSISPVFQDIKGSGNFMLVIIYLTIIVLLK